MLRVDPSEVGNRKTHLVGSVVRPVIGSVMIVVEQVKGRGEFVAAIDTHACGVDADSGHVATYGAHGIAHAQSLSRALVEGLRKQAGIVAALTEQRDAEQNSECCRKESLHGVRVKKTTFAFELQR